MTNYIEEILFSLSENRIRYIICGGLAAVLHGVERMRIGVDLSVDFEPTNMEKFLVAMNTLGLSPRAPVEADILLDETKITELINEKNARVFTFIDIENPYRQIDIFLTEDHSYQNLISFTDEIMIDTSVVKILSKEKLIELKNRVSPQREKDIWDIKELKKLL